jgi:hypothetical protein
MFVGAIWFIVVMTVWSTAGIVTVWSATIVDIWSITAIIDVWSITAIVNVWSAAGIVAIWSTAVVAIWSTAIVAVRSIAVVAVWSTAIVDVWSTAGIVVAKSTLHTGVGRGASSCWISFPGLEIAGETKDKGFLTSINSQYLVVTNSETLPGILDEIQDP